MRLIPPLFLLPVSISSLHYYPTINDNLYFVGMEASTSAEKPEKPEAPKVVAMVYVCGGEQKYWISSVRIVYENATNLLINIVLCISNYPS